MENEKTAIFIDGAFFFVCSLLSPPFLIILYTVFSVLSGKKISPLKNERAYSNELLGVVVMMCVCGEYRIYQ